MIDENVATMSQYIETHEQEVCTYDANFLKEVFDNGKNKIVMNGTSLIDKYIEELKIGSRLFYLTEDELRKYSYNPKRLSYDYFNGNTEYWFLILQINEMFSINEFNRDLIKIPSKTVVNKIIEIYNLEKPEIDLNEEELATKLYES